MKNPWFTLLGILLSMILVTSEAFGEDRHPRVVELEKALAAEALQVLTGRFPNKPFLATVNIDPLRREKKNSSSQERLPYYEIADEEIADEWDDPDATNTYLLNRVRRINVKLSVPSSLSDDEIAELKQAVTNNLSLIEARDLVDVQKRSWTNLESNSVWPYAGLGLVLWLLSMLGMGLISYFNSKKLSAAIALGSKESQKTPVQPLPPAPSEPMERGASSKTPVAGDLRFSDPIKTRESIQAAIRVIESHGQFPILEDMIILDKFAKEDLSSFGALLAEFPWEIRKKLFAYSTNDLWLQGLAEPGEVSNQCLEILQKCTRVQRAIERTDWQELLIVVWRLNDRSVDFFKDINQEKAFDILGYLPRSISVGVARMAYPGAWGVLLNPHHSPKMMNEATTAELIAKAKKISPLRDIELIEKYRSQKDLLTFVKTADPQIEKEIYQVTKDELHKIRPPFFPVFEAGEEVLNKLHASVRPEEWALSFYNIPKNDRRRIESLMNERQRIRCYEFLRAFDQTPPSAQRIGDAREKIAKTLHFHTLENLESISVVQDMTNRAA